MKELWFDTETTGLDPVKNDIIQIAGEIIIDDEIVEEFDIRCQPTSYKCVQQQALDVNGLTIEKIRTYQTSGDGCKEFVGIIEKYAAVFTAAGQNIPFDIRFATQWMIKNGAEENFEHYINHEVIDTKVIAKSIPKDILKVENHKLTTLAERFGIEFNAHEALTDIKATRAVYKELIKLKGSV